ncbi:NAD(P)-dependent dehydrogenase (short-subunit alcohol dehydrogenase family) [Actinocorallia herbida]|uniref:NAD(P)-dependent dehydrogenase (Short-subunit alcohol dehydrogenase family) n=1 Tax=Actinocorallia herbida TaxID=58109 RepID=A0A3N1D1T1_9ACTN|nr:SDR family oxidoreductase [Actinocorallia herbida]ROO87494.1 NAD(P)-dependent dehydrogenase (short-subunit alcohol dehydrogenase family) [Actinocorallia herbida]
MGTTTRSGARVALVTGASEGIGRAVAERLARDGYRVAMAARPSAKLERAAAEVGSGAFAVGCDLTRQRDAEKAVAQVEAHAGRIDALVNCASATRFGTALSLTDEEWVTGFEVKVFGALRLIRAAWPLLAASGGAVVSIGGIGARTPRDATAMSGPLSAALLALTKVFADRGRADGIRVNAVNPGAVRTPRFTAMLERQAAERGLALEELVAEMVRRDEITRLGTPQDIAGVVAFLLSAEGELLHGAIVDADGGRTKGI